MIRALTCLAATLLALVAYGPTAQACSCAPGLTYSLPAAGSEGVPLNPVLRIAYVYEEPHGQFTLRTGDEAPLALEASIAQVASLTEVTLTRPDAELLKPSTPYQLYGDETELISFTTGAAEDLTAPSLEAISQFKGGYDDGCTVDGDVIMCDSCGATTLMDLEYAGAGDDHTAAEELLYRIYVEEGTAIPDEDSYQVLLRSWWSLGQGACVTTYEGLEVGDTITVRAQTIDAAGNLSPLSDPVTAVVQEDPDEGGDDPGDDDGGCAGGGRAGAPLGAMGLLMLGWRRRP